MAPDALDHVRGIVARLFSERGYAREAAMVLAGEGDDFAEMRIGATLFAVERSRLARLRAALETYAGHDFWVGVEAEDSPAFEDRGAIARQVLADCL